MSWPKINMSVDTAIKVAATLVAIIGFALILDLNVREVQSKQESHIENYKEFRYNEVPETYMRKDVMEQVLIRLERIEKKLDRRNGE